MGPDAIKEIMPTSQSPGWAVPTRSPRRFSGSAVLAPASCSAWPCRLTAALQLTEAPPSADRCQSAQKTRSADLREIETAFSRAKVHGVRLRNTCGRSSKQYD
jgi:hypothetical protein